MALRLVPHPASAANARSGAVDEASRAVIVGAARGDADSCRAFVARYEHLLFTVCARLTGDRRAGEDAAQETFLRAFRALPRFDVDGPARVSTWLVTIATNVCRDERRRAARRPVLVDVSALHAEPGADCGAFDLAARRQLEARLHAALAALPEAQRDVFVLRVLAERTVAETAAALGVDEGTVKSRLSRARDALLPALTEGAP